MPAKVVSTSNVEHYTWGGPHADTCDGWYLVQSPNLSVIAERMPPGSAEMPHHHVHSRQFFYVLEGDLTMDIEFHIFKLKPNEGIEVQPGQRHLASNTGSSDLRILVTSQPPSHGDRIED
jgi:mannose-6-phosphate isomerase-like protein (cupin superfamily)